MLYSLDDSGYPAINTPKKKRSRISTLSNEDKENTAGVLSAAGWREKINPFPITRINDLHYQFMDTNIIKPCDHDNKNRFLKQYSVVVCLGLLFIFLVSNSASIAADFPQTLTASTETKNVQGFNLMHSAMSGATAGVLRGFTRLFTFPLDTIKTRQQVGWLEQLEQEGTVLGSKLEASGTSNKSKLAQFFNGASPVFMVNAPANAAFFCVYDLLNTIFAQSSIPINPRVGHLLSSVAATLPNNAIRIPAEVVKQRCQVDSKQSALSTTISIFKEENLKGFFIGGKAQLAREIPFNAIQFLAYEWIRESRLSDIFPPNLKPFSSAIDGFLAASTGCILTQPVDTVKTRLMTKRNSFSSNQESYSLLECVNTIAKNEGFGALFAGLLPRLIIVSSGGAIYFWANSAVKTFFEQLQNS